MSQAADILQEAAGLDDAIRTAELATDLVEHEGDATLYTFDDDSVLLIDGVQMAAYDDIQAARKALAP